MHVYVKENLDKWKALFSTFEIKRSPYNKSKINKSIFFIRIFPSRYYEYILLKKKIIIIEYLQMDESIENNSIPAN